MIVLCDFFFFSGALKLWLEQEGEAQFSAERRGLHTTLQPGKPHFLLLPHYFDTKNDRD